MRTRTRVRAAAGFTIVELAVALAVLGLLLAFTLPKVVGSATFAEDQKAQTTASGAMDVIAQRFVEAGASDGMIPFEATDASDGSLCTDPADTDPNTPRRLLDRDHAIAPDSTEGKALAAGTPLRLPLVPPPPTPQPDGYALRGDPTNCPVFANPTSLGAATGDVTFVAGDKTSTNSSVASVAAWVMGNSKWRVGVAVLAPQSRGTVASCWMVWRDFPFSGGGAATEEYFVNTSVTPSDPTGCTGTGVVPWDPETLPCKNFDGSTGDATAGTSWRRPCGNYITP